MFTYRGIALDAWVKVEGNCPIKWEVAGDEARFEIGPRVAVLSLTASEEGLEELVTAASDALRAMRAQDGQGKIQTGRNRFCSDPGECGSSCPDGDGL